MKAGFLPILAGPVRGNSPEMDAVPGGRAERIERTRETPLLQVDMKGKPFREAG